ncbi:MAG: folylpolyglutamate synthase/dihydrofolate synthase family protein [Acidimicrobiales bacterium]
MRSLCTLMGDPQRAYPVVHVTGTNGKGSTTRMLSAILAEHGLSVGTYTSPHLERLNERLAWNDEVIDDESLAQVLLEVRSYEVHLGAELTHFEVLTAAALRWFADVAVDVAVLEVGMGGRWDSTNVADGEVAVVTNIGLDHAEIIGPTRREIATEKAGIVKEGATAILGETSADLAEIFAATPAAVMWVRDRDFGAERNLVAIGGRLIDVRTPGGVLDDLFMPLHGPHQGDNAACAVAAAEAFFGRPLDADVVRTAMGKVTVPGRFEVMGRRPFVVLDGAHNPDGARALAATLDEDFAGRRPDVCVVGFTQGRDAAEMLAILRASESRLVVVCPPPTPRALPVTEVLAAAESLGVRAVAAPDVTSAVARALDETGEDEFVLVTGSLYVVGDARTALRR